MILDSLKNKEQYESLHPRFRRVFDYIDTHDLASMEPGRYDIDGDKIFVMVQELELRPYEQARLELHRKYIDIQLVLNDNEEHFGWSDKRDCLTPESEFDTTKDIQLFVDKPQCVYTVRRGQFSILFPEDGHAPMLGEGMVKKCIFKILL